MFKRAKRNRAIISQQLEKLEQRTLFAVDISSAAFQVQDAGESVSSQADIYLEADGTPIIDLTVADRRIATANTFHVDDDATAGGDGSSASPFDNIATALAALRGNVQNATLLVEPGEYTWGRQNTLGYDLNVIGSGTGNDPAVDTIVRHVADGNASNLYAAQFRSGSTYIEGITFDGAGTSQIALDVRNANSLTLVDSEFTNSGTGDGVNIVNVADVVVHNSTAHNNQKDGFSYTSGTTGATMNVLEAYVHSYDNGQDGEWNSQGSSVHRTVNIVRVGGTYENNPTNISDVSTGNSWNIDVTTRNPLSDEFEGQYLNVNLSGGVTGWFIGGDHSQGDNAPVVVRAAEDSQIRHVSQFDTLAGTHTVVGSTTVDDSPLVSLFQPTSPNGAGFELETIASGLVLPTAFAVAPDGRIFVAEKKGRIKVIENGEITSTFLDISDEVASVGDRGLIGLALDPDFENNGHVFYQYTILDPDGDGITPDEDGDGRVEGVGGAVERVTVSAGDANVADASTRVTVLDGHRMNASTHSVGDIDFDNDGNLIFSWGDGGFGDIRLEAQDKNSVQGKVFRINPTTFEGVPENPFYEAENPNSVASKVWALGIRNSWKLTVDRPTGDVYFGEVTDRGPEEVNVIRGDGSTELNFGWPYYEGNGVKPSYADEVPEGFTFEAPLIELPHLDLGGGDAITGGAVYRGDKYPSVYSNRYFFGNVVQGLMYTADAEGNFQQFGNPGDYLGVADIQMGPDGHLWTMSLFTGTLSRLTYDPALAAEVPPTIKATQSRSAGAGTVDVQFDASQSTAIDGGTLTYAWDFESDGTVDSTEAAPSTSFSSLGRTTTTLVVTDETGATATQLFETDVLETVDETNLALGRPTTGSPVAFGGLASRVVDGGTNGIFGDGSVSLTQPIKNPYWEVDLGGVFDIGSIDIFERTDPSGRRLENFVVLVSENTFSSGNLEAIKADEGVVFTNVADMDDLLTIEGENGQAFGRGRYVRIQSAEQNADLAIAEVRVFEWEDPNPTPHQITRNGDAVTVVATDGDDVVQLTLGDTQHVLNISGTVYTFDSSETRSVHIDGGEGDDTVHVTGTSNAERIRLNAEGEGTLTSSTFNVSTENFDRTEYKGNGGDDYAELVGSLGDDRLSALPRDSTLTSPDRVIRAYDMDRVDSYGRKGNDYASMYGTLEDDLYFTRDNYALLKGGDVTTFTKGFERVDAFGRGGNDRASLYDSPRFDLFVALPTYAYLSNGTRISYTKGFERVDAYSQNGGDDRVVFYDDAESKDQFTERADYAFMFGDNYLHYAAGFHRVEARSTGGGDIANVLEAKSTDHLFANGVDVELMSAARNLHVTGFERVVAEADEDQTPTYETENLAVVLQLRGNWFPPAT